MNKVLKHSISKYKPISVLFGSPHTRHGGGSGKNKSTPKIFIDDLLAILNAKHNFANSFTSDDSQMQKLQKAAWKSMSTNNLKYIQAVSLESAGIDKRLIPVDTGQTRRSYTAQANWQ